MDLAGEQDRVHRHAEIVDDRVVDDLGCAGLRIDLDLADMGAVRIGRLVLDELAEAFEVAGLLGRLGDRRKADRRGRCRRCGRVPSTSSMSAGRGLQLVGGDRA